MHRVRRDQITGVHDKDLNSNTSKSRRNIKCPAPSRDSTEESISHHCDEPEDETRDEELGRSTSQVRHEVDKHVEDNDLDKHKRYIHHRLRNSKCRGSVEGEGLV